MRVDVIPRSSGFDSPSQFVPLTLVGSASVEIELPCGAVLRAPGYESLLRQVLAILLEADAGETGLFSNNCSGGIATCLRL